LAVAIGLVWIVISLALFLSGFLFMSYRIMALFFSVVLISSCSGLAQQTNSVADEYQQNFQIWQQTGWKDYDLIYQRQCFCLAEVLRKIRVEVRDGKIANAVYADDGSAIAAEIDYSLKSVSDWFELIAEAIDRPAEGLQVSYDEMLGFPNSISIDYYRRMADDEVMVEIFDVIRK